MAYEWRACSHSLNAPAWHATSHVLYARTLSAARRTVHADVDMLSARPAWRECMHRLAVKRSPKETGASSRAPYRRNTTGGTGGTVYSRTACNFRMPCLYAGRVSNRWAPYRRAAEGTDCDDVHAGGLYVLAYDLHSDSTHTKSYARGEQRGGGHLESRDRRTDQRTFTAPLGRSFRALL